MFSNFKYYSKKLFKKIIYSWVITHLIIININKDQNYVHNIIII